VPSKARSAVAPLYLVACLILGGSAQGAWQNALLQLAGIAILAWAAAAPANDPPSRPAKALLLLAIAALVVVALQQVPLPPSFWAHGARARVAEGYAVLGRAPPWLPMSLTPYESLASLLWFIPPLAIFVAIVRLNAYRLSWLAAALLCGLLAGMMLGALQVASAGPNSQWYLYPETNWGSAVGFFANANHMATLLLIGLPFLAAIGAAARSRGGEHYSALLSLVGALALVLLVGIALNRSLAGYVLVVPVLAGSALVMLPPASLARRLAISLAGLSVIAAVVALTTSSIASGRRFSQNASTSFQSREVILNTTGKAISDFMPLGSGLGSFVRVYRLYESPDSVSTEYVIHAHNDYVELALELGVAGIILMLAFLLWWVTAVVAVWRTGKGGSFARAASIASATVLVHSLVDFPLRTAAISVCFAMCLGLLAERRPVATRRAGDLRPSRHLAFG
jgi:O-antigen ligase